MSLESIHIPETLLEATRYFADPDVAHKFMVALRWPGGPVCPYCNGTEHSFISTRKTWQCKSCRKRFTVKVGTIMEDSPISIDKWLLCMWYIGDCKNGISSHEIARHLGLTQKTTWFLMHRIRMAMQRGSWEKFDGEVEVDESYVGGKAKNNKHKNRKRPTGTGVVGKAVVMGILRRNREGEKSKVRAKVVINHRKKTLQPEIHAAVVPGSALFTDDSASYNGLNETYIHQTIDHAVAYAVGKISTNAIEGFWSMLDRMLNGSYVSVDPDHLNKYVDEEAFRFNERADTPAGRFMKIAMNVAGKRLTWNQLTERAPGTKPRRGGYKRKAATAIP